MIPRGQTLFKIARKFTREALEFCVYKYRMAIPPRYIENFGVRVPLKTVYSANIRSAICRKVYEAQELRCLFSKLRPGDVVLEIGTGIGVTSTLCARRLGSQHVITFEANPSLVDLASETHRLNGVSPRIEHALVWTDNGIRRFFVSEDLWSSSVERRNNTDKEISVRMLAGAGLFHAFKPTVLIVDVEGGEATLIPYLAAGRALEGVRAILIELHPDVLNDQTTRDIRNKLTYLGFTVDADVSSNRVVFLERLTWDIS